LSVGGVHLLSVFVVEFPAQTRSVTCSAAICRTLYDRDKPVSQSKGNLNRDMNRSYFVCSGRLQHLLNTIDCHLCHSLLPFLPFGAVNSVLLL
jgi:hypothetical protein